MTLLLNVLNDLQTLVINWHFTISPAKRSILLIGLRNNSMKLLCFFLYEEPVNTKKTATDDFLRSTATSKFTVQ